jgi:hypothetical protein
VKKENVDKNSVSCITYFDTCKSCYRNSIGIHSHASNKERSIHQSLIPTRKLSMLASPEIYRHQLFAKYIRRLGSAIVMGKAIIDMEKKGESYFMGYFNSEWHCMRILLLLMDGWPSI